MVRISSIIAVFALLGAMLPARPTVAQSTLAFSPATAAPDNSAEPNPLPGLPQPPDLPGSLMLAVPASPAYSCSGGPSCCYWEADANLDPPPLPPPGGLGDLEVGILVAHVKNQLTDTVQVGNRAPDTVNLSSARLAWTASPRIELGSRLPSGFGEFDIAYRFLDTNGSGTAAGLDTAAILKSRFDLNSLDLDYASNEISLLPEWGLKWRIGLRTSDLFFDSRADEPFAAAAAGSGFFEQRESDHYWGIGPHVAWELERRWSDSGLNWVARLDGAALIGKLHQNFSEVSTTVAPGGGFLSGETTRLNDQDVPMINAFLGLDWRPQRYPNLRMVAGYQYEYWWKVGQMNSTASKGEAGDQGAVLRAEFNY